MSILQTERLSLDKATEKDASFFYKLLNSPNWIQFIGDRGINNEEDALNYIKNSLIHSYNTFGFGLYKVVLKENNIPVGICGFVKRDYLNHPDIGFAILPKYEGNGFAFEAAQEIVNYGLSTLGMEQILGITTPGNIKSQNLLLKIGLQQVGFISPDDDQKEHLLFSFNH
ncbi:GNAT family N-acetyltransferase [Spongiivirga sp. MCCC 1A20706]|uniref:GNAT family N-acetyltransferase n=1 Tax=Spongiivirga sp. MCCC 1A20706 TaxID=3160963 RepID=UPI003977B1EA